MSRQLLLFVVAILDVLLVVKSEKCSEACKETIGDGVCQTECNIEICYWDYLDCYDLENYNKCLEYCEKEFNNGICDQKCYNYDCQYDLNDCGY